MHANQPPAAPSTRTTPPCDAVLVRPAMPGVPAPRADRPAPPRPAAIGIAASAESSESAARDEHADEAGYGHGV